MTDEIDIFGGGRDHAVTKFMDEDATFPTSLEVHMIARAVGLGADVASAVDCRKTLHFVHLVMVCSCLERYDTRFGIGFDRHEHGGKRRADLRHYLLGVVRRKLGKEIRRRDLAKRRKSSEK